MSELQPKSARESRAVKASIVLPPDTNHHGNMFGGKVMAYVDDIAAISAMRHCRQQVVTASTDSVDFLHPIREGDSICLESFVTWTRKTSMEVFVKVTAEDLMTGNRTICATSFLTFVAIGPDKRPVEVPGVIPESDLEKHLYQTAPQRAEVRHARRKASKQFAEDFPAMRPWDK